MSFQAYVSVKGSFPLMDQFWGDRYGQVKDPFGHNWSIGSPQKNITADEVDQAAKNHFV